MSLLHLLPLLLLACVVCYPCSLPNHEAWLCMQSMKQKLLLQQLNLHRSMETKQQGGNAKSARKWSGTGQWSQRRNLATATRHSRWISSIVCALRGCNDKPKGEGCQQCCCVWIPWKQRPVLLASGQKELITRARMTMCQRLPGNGTIWQIKLIHGRGIWAEGC